MFLGITIANRCVRYNATYLISMGCFPFVAFVNAQVAGNVVSDTAKAAAVCTCGFLKKWEDSFQPGHICHLTDPSITLAMVSTLSRAVHCFLPSIALLLFMIVDNKLREKRDVDAELPGHNQQEVQVLEWRYPAFRWQT